MLVFPAGGNGFALHHLEEQACPPPRGMHLFAGGHIAGAHGAGPGFAAAANPHAAQDSFGKLALVVRELEVGVDLDRTVIGDAEVLIEG